jgi:16S rRNA processing protein RimM
VRFTDITDRNASETLRGLHLYLPRHYLPPLPPGHFYYFEAANAQVVDKHEGPKGTLQEIVPGTAYDFFVVRGPQGEIYWVPAPFVGPLDKSTDPPTLWVEAPPGLWDPTLAQGRP